MLLPYLGPRSSVWFVFLFSYGQSLSFDQSPESPYLYNKMYSKHVIFMYYKRSFEHSRTTNNDIFFCSSYWLILYFIESFYRCLYVGIQTFARIILTSQIFLIWYRKMLQTTAVMEFKKCQRMAYIWKNFLFSFSYLVLYGTIQWWIQNYWRRTKQPHAELHSQHRTEHHVQQSSPSQAPCPASSAELSPAPPLAHFQLHWKKNMLLGILILKITLFETPWRTSSTSNYMAISYYTAIIIFLWKTFF